MQRVHVPGPPAELVEDHEPKAGVRARALPRRLPQIAAGSGEHEGGRRAAAPQPLAAEAVGGVELQEVQAPAELDPARGGVRHVAAVDVHGPDRRPRPHEEPPGAHAFARVGQQLEVRGGEAALARVVGVEHRGVVHRDRGLLGVPLVEPQRALEERDPSEGARGDDARRAGQEGAQLAQGGIGPLEVEAQHPGHHVVHAARGLELDDVALAGLDDEVGHEGTAGPGEHVVGEHPRGPRAGAGLHLSRGVAIAHDPAVVHHHVGPGGGGEEERREHEGRGGPCAGRRRHCSLAFRS